MRCHKVLRIFYGLFGQGRQGWYHWCIQKEEVSQQMGIKSWDESKVSIKGGNKQVDQVSGLPWKILRVIGNESSNPTEF